MSNIIDKIQVSGVTYDIGGSGGGKAIEAGTNISVTTGETADTINCTLPFSHSTSPKRIVGNSQYSLLIGRDNGVSTYAQNSLVVGENSRITNGSNISCAVAIGYSSTANTSYSTAIGTYVKTNNNSELSTGKYNVSNTGSTDADKTLFSVGNGTADNARHNAFEIRKNGDIYLSSGGTDIKLQDHLGGGGGGGNPTVELTQAEYDALVTAGTVSADTYYIITDAQAGDLTQYWTSAQTQSAITQSVSGKANSSDVYLKTETSGATEISTALNEKQDTLVSSVNIKTINNTSLLGSGNIDIQGGGGGGKAIEAGRGISVTTGETADTVSFNLPISADSNNNITIGALNLNNDKGKELNFLFGSGNAVKTPANYDGKFNCIFGFGNQVGKVQGRYATQYNAMFGSSNYCYLNNSLICGNNNATYNNSEFSSGQYNNSVSGSSTFGDSGNTLFSVGNGTSSSARHNAFEIRQNGDIYLSSGGTDIKLQDHLGGGGGSITIDQTFDRDSTNAIANSAVTRNTVGSYDSASTGGKTILQAYDQKGYGINALSIGFSKINNTPIFKNYSNLSELTNFNLVETSAITTAITSSSTDAQVPSAKAVYDIVGDIETLLSQI